MGAMLSEPRWAHAAQALVDGCVDLPDDEDRVALLAAVCEGDRKSTRLNSSHG